MKSSNPSTTFVVRTRDVDGSTRKSFKSLAGARKRFAEMLGRSIEDEIAFQRDPRSTEPLPPIETVRYVEGVSDYGTVVSFRRVEANPEEV